MKNTFGSSIAITIIGESHGKMIGAVIDGMPSGITVDDDFIKMKLAKRKAKGTISTARHEADEYNIVSGVFNGVTTGTPITILIENSDTRSKDYSLLKDTPRPSHADYTASIKYGGFQDYRGGGHFSGRITAALVAAGALIEAALRKKGIYIGTHIKKLGSQSDRDFKDHKLDLNTLDGECFPVLDGEAGGKMSEIIKHAAKNGDSIGGVLESAVIGVPAGIGEPFFDSLEGELSHILFSIPGIKGVEFGAGFAFADMYGSEANDEFCIINEKICTKTNNNGGINGGISNGMPIIFRTAVKPTPSIYKEQNTVSLSRCENTTLKIEGRHDPAIIHRAAAVQDAAAAIAIADMLATKYGTDWLR